MTVSAILRLCDKLIEQNQRTNSELKKLGKLVTQTRFKPVITEYLFINEPETGPNQSETSIRKLGARDWARIFVTARPKPV